MRRAAVLFASLLLALPVAGCGGGEEAAPTAEEVEGTVPGETEAENGGQAAQGNAEAGKELFAAQGCGGCHVFEPAGTNGTTGPNLDESLQGDDEDYIRESIVDPSADVVDGFPDIMPKDYDEKLSDQQLADLVTFLSQGQS